MKRTRTALVATIVVALLASAALASCAKGKETSFVRTESVCATQAEKAAKDSPINRINARFGQTPFDATKLNALGFHVFKEPIPLPNREVVGLNGAKTAFNSFRGKVTLLNFWATWCPPCRKEMPSIQRLHDLMKGTEFSIAAISVGETAKDVKAFIDKEGYSFPVFMDESGALGGEFASQGIPSTYIVNKEGFIVAGTVGSREYDDPALVDLLKELSR